MHIELTFGRTKQRETSVGRAGSPEVRPKRAEPERNPLPSSALPALFVNMTSAPGTRTRHSNKLLFSLVQPPKLLRKHDKAWTHSTSQLQSHFSKSQPSASPGPVPSLVFSPARPPSDDTQCQGCQSRFQKYFSVTYVTLVGIWTASSSPSQTSLLGHGNVPCATLLPPHPRVHCDTSASSLPSETLTLTKHHLEKGNKIQTKLK